jgi:hypothetical protein
MSAAAPPSANYTTVTFANVAAFFKGPRSHMQAKYNAEKANVVTLLCYMSLASFIWQIVVIASVPRAIAFIAIGDLVAFVYATNGIPEGFTSVWFKVWKGIEALLLVLSVILAFTFVGAPIAWAAIALTGWALDLGYSVFLIRKLDMLPK